MIKDLVMSVTNVPAIDPILLVRAESRRHVSPSSSILSSSPSPPPLLKRSAEEELTSTYPKKSTRSSEEEKLARRLARQQRNRKSAQVSREKKKAYVDQLEHDVAVLRAEKEASELRERIEASKRLELEGRITDLNAKVVQLESVLSMLLKVGGNALCLGLQGGNTSADDVQKVKEELSVDEAYVSLLSSAQASAAPAAVSTLAADAHSMENHSDPCTRLPAVKATSSSTIDDELALQRVHFTEKSSSLRMRSVHRPCRRLERPMAAALHLTTFLSKTHHPLSTQTPPTLCSPLPMCSSLRSSLKTTPATGEQGTRMLRLRFKIPQDRLAKVLKKYSMIPPVA